MLAPGGPVDKVADLIQWSAVFSSLPAISPMQPTLVREPFHSDGWVYKEKYTSWRIVAYKDDERVRLVSRNEKGGIMGEQSALGECR